MGCETSKSADVIPTNAAPSPNRHESVKLTKSKTLSSPKLIFKNDDLMIKNDNSPSLRTLPPLKTHKNGEVPNYSDVRETPDGGISVNKSVLLQDEFGQETTNSAINFRNASASSTISNISTASKGISYDFRIPGDGSQKGKARLPTMIENRLKLSNESQLTMDKLQKKLNNVAERKQKLIQGKKEQAVELARPKTALVRKKPEEVQGNELREKLEAAAEKRQEKMTEIKEKQLRREQRAQRVREKANEVQNPDFETRLDTFSDQAIDAPVTPILDSAPRPLPSIPESSLSKTETDEFFDN